MNCCTSSYSGYGPAGNMYRYALGCFNGAYGGDDRYSCNGYTGARGGYGYGCGPCGGPNGTYGCGTDLNYGYNTCYGDNAGCGNGFAGNGFGNGFNGIPPRNVSWASTACGPPTAFNYGGVC